MTDLNSAISKLNSGELTSVDLVNSCFENIDAREEQIGAFLFLNKKSALIQAQKSDQRRKDNKLLGNLDGIPIAIKDLIVTKDMPSTAGSKILEGFMSPFDATVVQNLKDQGAVIIGKLNQDEFAMGSSNEFSAYKPCKNPLDITRTPGGSSGGSAASVAADFCLGSLGTETGGSVRQPASFCGVVGVKPSYGRVSRLGVMAFASSLDQVGPVAKDVKGAALMLEAIAGYDAGDSTSINQPVPKYSENLDCDLKNLKIGLAKEFLETEGLDLEIKNTVGNSISLFKRAGSELVDINLPHLPNSVAVYYVVATAEASSNLSRYDGVRYGPRRGENEGLTNMYEQTRGELFGPEVKRRIMLGTYVLSAGYYDAYYLKAQQVRTKIAEDFESAFEKVDVIIGPTTPTTAFKIGEKIDDPVQMYLNDIFTIGASLAGLCAISVPSGLSKEGLPMSTQIIAKAFNEEKMFQAAYALENMLEQNR